MRHAPGRNRTYNLLPFQGGGEKALSSGSPLTDADNSGQSGVEPARIGPELCNQCATSRLSGTETPVSRGTRAFRGARVAVLVVARAVGAALANHEPTEVRKAYLGLLTGGRA